MAFLKRAIRPSYLLDPIESRHGDIALEICSFVSGALDAISLTNWAVFVGMQTGNTVLLGLSTAALPSDAPYNYAKTLVSITSFLCGAFTTFCLHRVIQPSRSSAQPKARLLRIHIVLPLVLQTLLLVLAATLASTPVVPQVTRHGAHVPPSMESDHRILGALAPLAFQNGMQVACGRLLGFNEIPTIVLTSVYCDLTSDLVGLQKVNPKRDRRLASVLLLFSGAVSAAWMIRAGAGVEGVVWMCAGLKAILSIGCWLGLQSVTPAEEKDAGEAGGPGEAGGLEKNG